MCILELPSLHGSTTAFKALSDAVAAANDADGTAAPSTTLGNALLDILRSEGTGRASNGKGFNCIGNGLCGHVQHSLQPAVTATCTPLWRA